MTPELMRSLPNLVIAADWSTDGKKRWMVRAERVDPSAYVVYPPEPVGDLTTLISRLRKQVRVLTSGNYAMQCHSEK